MPGDEAVEEYLNTVSSYAEAKESASEAWKEGFLQLARARLSQEVSYTSHDPSLPAEVTVDLQKFELHLNPQTNPISGAWPSTSLRSARTSFVEALKLEMQAHLAKTAQTSLP